MATAMTKAAQGWRRGRGPFAASLRLCATCLLLDAGEALAQEPVPPPPSAPDPGAAPEPTPVGAVDEYEGVRDGDAGRLIWSSTAFTRDEGRWNASVFNLGYWTFDYGISPNVTLKLSTTVPVMNLSLLPGIKFGFPVSDAVSVGLQANVGVFGYYLEELDLITVVYGGGPMLTIGNENSAFNLAVLAFGATVFMPSDVWDADGHYGEEWDQFTGGILLPNVGGFVRVSKRVKLMLEVHVPGLLEESGEALEETFGRIWVVMYGLRIMGQDMYGDVCFALPLFEGVWEYIRYTPMGFPFLGFGFGW